MNLCSTNHEEICYDCRKCPLCEIIAEVDSLEEENKTLLEKVSTLESDVTKLEDAVSQTSVR